ncbi:hypothetical protein MNB_SV-14-595 [hydrothermal vent metagenome]|uniref:Uncharacterized protein n=1 Tax=hydrothermal vent metagenome TaxID=652676 RepID=A0A1W1C6K4_9ZZZZ
MIGTVLLFDKETNEGEILGVDKKTYDFHIGEWLSSCSINIGQKVYYEIVDDEARNIIINEHQKVEYIIHLKIDVCSNLEEFK